MKTLKEAYGPGVEQYPPTCSCEHWETCPKCKPEWYTQDGKKIIVTKEMLGAAHDILLKKELMIPRTLIESIYTAMRHKEAS